MPERARSFPLTPMQAGMIFDAMSSMPSASPQQKTGPRYLSLIHYRLPHPHDPEALCQRWRVLAQVHPALRTRFSLDGAGSLGQSFPEEHWPECQRQELSAIPAQDRDRAIRDYLQMTRSQGMDPFVGPLCRLVLFDGEQGTGIRDISVIFHHAMLDGWSLSLLLQQLLAEAAPQEKGVPFSRYLRFLSKRDQAADLAYWRSRLAGAEAACRLPGQIPDREQGRSESAQHRFELPDSSGLHALSQQLRLSPGRLLHALWALLLCRYNGGQALFGHVITGRMGTVPGVMEMVGMTVNTLPIWVELPEEERFSAWIEVWNAQLSADERHGFTAPTDLNKLVPGYADHLFVVDPAPTPEGPEWVAGYGEAVADFSAGFELGERIQACFSYHPGKYPPQAVARMARHFCQILAAVMQNPAIRLKEISCLPAEEQALLLRSDPPLPGAVDSLTALWHTSAAAHADRLALVCGQVRMDYAELARRVDALSAGLIAQGVVRGDLVALRLERSQRIVIAVLAVWQAGAAYLPLSSEWPVERIDQVLADTQPVLVLDDRAFDRLEQTPKTTSFPGVSQPEDPAYVIMTSGSTGRPKGVVVAHRQLLAFCAWAMERYRWGPGFASAIQTEFAYDVALWGLYPALLSGGAVHILGADQRHNLHRIRDYLVQETISHLDLPVALAEEFMATFPGSEAPPGLRYLATGGDALSRYTPVPYEVVNEYGPTECTVSCTARTLSQPMATIPIGRPLPGMRAYLLDQQRRLVPLGVAGELCFSGPQVAQGYLHDDHLTAEKFIDNPFFDPARDGPEHQRLYRTGDLACWQPDLEDERGELHFLGRLDNQVKVRGHRVELGEIQSRLQSHPGVERAVVALRSPDGGAEKRLLAWVVCTAATCREETLTAFLAEKLPSYMIPTLIKTEQLPLTPGGKIDLAALPTPHLAAEDLPTAPPETPAERVLMATLTDLLPGAAANVLSTFLALGGDSINAIRLVARLESQGWQLLLREVMTPVSLRVLAEKMTPLDPAEDSVSVPLPLPEAGFSQRVEAEWGEGTAILPPTPTQRMLLTQAELSGPDAYAVVGHYRLPDGAPSAEEIGQRLAQAMERHDVLRAGFARDEAGEFWMLIPPQAATPFVFHPEDAANASRLQQRLAEMRRGLDPYRAPLIRLEIFHLGEGQLEMLLHYHHLILDGWSLSLLFDELFAESPTPPMPTRSFGDYLCWVHAQRAAQPADGFWQTRFPDHSRPADLPAWPEVDAPEPEEAIQTLPLLTPEAFRACTDAARRATVTPAAFFMALWMLLLERYVDSPEAGPMLLGFVSAGRPAQPGMESLVGMCARTLPLRLEPTVDRSLADFASAIQAAMAEVQSRHDLPDTLVGRLPRHLFSYETQGEKGARLPKVLSIHGQDGYDLVMLLRDGPEPAASLRFNPRAVAPDLAARLQATWQIMAERVSREPMPSIGGIADLPEAEHRLLTQEFGWGKPLAVDCPTAVHAFRAAAARFPDRPALAQDSVSLSFAQLDHWSDRIARQLLEMGAGRGAVVGAVMSRSLAGAAAPLAIMKAGAVYLPLSPDWPRSRIQALLTQTQAPILITDCPAISGMELPTLRLTDDWADGPEADKAPIPLPEPSGADLAYVIGTSGTTGRPKATAVSHQALANQVAWTLDRFGPGCQDRMLHTIAFSFDPSLWQLFPFWAAGACVDIAAATLTMDSSALMTALHTRAITYLALPTRVGDLLFDYAREGCPPNQTISSRFPPSLSRLFIGGEAPQRLSPVDFEVFNAYGPTEACIQACLFPVAAVSGATGIIGRPLANMRAYVVDAGLRLCPLGVAGELCLSGPQLAREYLGMPEETARVFLPNPFSAEPGFERIYRTGDRVRWRPDGQLEFLGRNDGQLKIRGYRIETEEVRRVLLAAPGVKDALIQVQYDPAGQPSRLDAYFIPRDEISEQTQIRDFLRSRLPAYMLPASFTPVQQWPLNAHGKLDAEALPEPVLDTPPGTPPQTEAERAMARAWEKVLGISEICREESFFDLGGHSLQLLRVMGHLADTHLIELQDFFKTPILSELATRMRPVKASVTPVTQPDRDSAEGDSHSGEDSPYQALVATAAQAAQSRPYQVRRLMITGATGYLGAFLLKEYLEQTEAEILVPVRGERDPGERLSRCFAGYFGPEAARSLDCHRVNPVSADLSRPQDVAALAAHGPLDMILHSAAAVNHYGEPEPLIAANVTATELLLELAACHEQCRFAHISTLSAINRPEFSELTEDLGPPAPNLYSRTKQEAEQRVLQARAGGLDALIFRTGNLILDTQHQRFPQSAPTNLFLRLARMMAKTGLCTEGAGKMGPTFVDQAARAIRLLAGQMDPAVRIFHIDNPHQMTLPRMLSLALPEEQAIRGLPLADLKAQLRAMAQADPGDRGEAALEYLAWIGQQEREREEGEILGAEAAMEWTLAVLAELKFVWSQMSSELAAATLQRALTLDES